MLKTLTGATALALLLAPAALAQAEAPGGDTVFRVFIGDHAAPRITAFDLSAPESRWVFDTIGQAKLYAVAEGSAVAAVQSDAGTVQFLSSGIRLEDHGDHQDIEITEPTALPHRLDGPRPFHLVDHGQQIAINLDQGGYAEILDGAALAQGRLEGRRFPQSVAHHGFVAPLGGFWLSSVAPEPDEGAEPAPRLGLQAFTAEGTPAGDLATCTGIHGEAFSGLYLAAGCAEGVLTARSGDDGIVFEMLPYPAELPAGNTTGTLLGATGMQVFMGNYGRDALVVIDPADGAALPPCRFRAGPDAAGPGLRADRGRDAAPDRPAGRQPRRQRRRDAALLDGWSLERPPAPAGHGGRRDPDHRPARGAGAPDRRGNAGRSRQHRGRRCALQHRRGGGERPHPLNPH